MVVVNYQIKKMNKWLKLVISIAMCELVGIVGTPFTIAAIPSWYSTLNRPFFSPPNWLFAPVWTTLYLMMGIAFFLIWNQGFKKSKTKEAAHLFFIQLFLNGIWSPIFFGLKSPFLGLIVIATLWGYLLDTINKFRALSKPAAYLLYPYFGWVSFATLLNAAIVILN
ncbi:MAG TPA: tryptophan-rich sensory protein [Candidatus Woesebacteria bacterium]|nr:tryptophan-rich sensory protein [Candidatus Woesebacteria bacterium]